MYYIPFPLDEFEIGDLSPPLPSLWLLLRRSFKRHRLDSLEAVTAPSLWLLCRRSLKRHRLGALEDLPFELSPLAGDLIGLQKQ
ncbi:unnamed protein product [Thlaspi arvense]|uniref:Uncharacterized protein n=1 Tax=Thlaspi arvense TaxID=13288 RepID=A0AAU9SVC5_THLAR|nr:unnamed protein product [Thlaspi arvense]